MALFWQVFVTGTNSAQWSFRHEIVDKQYYSASMGIAVFSFFLQFFLFDYVEIFVEKGVIFY